MQRLVTEYEVTTLFHLAALLSTRAGTTRISPTKSMLQGPFTCLNWRTSKAVGVVAGQVYLPVLHRRLWYSEFGGKGGVATPQGMGATGSHHNVWLQQSLLRTFRALLCAALSATCSPAQWCGGGLSKRPVPRVDFRRDHSQRRDL